MSLVLERRGEPERTRRWAFWSLMVFLVVAYLGNIYGPPPPSGPALWIFGIVSSAILLLWTWWADRHRVQVTST